VSSTSDIRTDLTAGAFGPDTARVFPTHTDEARTRVAAPLIALADEPPPTLNVDSPLAEPLAHGKVFIQYSVDHIRILPVFGVGALDVSPRIGHLHITVDDLPWHYVDASGDTIIIVGLLPGAHHILVELADPTHHVIAHQRVCFEIPPRRLDP
jgi:hypothetical protein